MKLGQHLVILIAVPLVFMALFWTESVQILDYPSLPDQLLAFNDQSNAPPQITRPKRAHLYEPVEEAWINEVDTDKRLVSIETVVTKIKIIFQIKKEEIGDFEPPNITPVTLICSQNKDKKCDFSKPYKLYIAGQEVKKPKEIKYLN